jgi:flagella basal body P-ring formation protein FlgA
MGRSAKMITPDTPLPQAAVKAAILFLGGDIVPLVANVSEFIAACLLFYCTEKLSN